MPTVYYQGERIYLRPLELDDEPTLTRWLNDQSNWSTLRRFLPISAAREREYLEGLYKNPDPVTFGIVVRQGDRLIGCAGLQGFDNVARNAEFGILIGEPDAKGGGYGAEATRLITRYGFEQLNLHRINLSAFAGNEAGLRAYKSAGYVEEGRRRQAYYRDGRYHDEIIMGILREDWQRHVGASQPRTTSATAPEAQHAAPKQCDAQPARLSERSATSADQQSSASAIPQPDRAGVREVNDRPATALGAMTMWDANTLL